MSELIGTYDLKFDSFPNTVYEPFSSGEFTKLAQHKKFEAVSEALCSAVKETKEPCFLLPAVTQFIQRIRKDVLEEYSFSAFELWLDQLSKLSREENLHVRGKIVGKIVPRGAYQIYFPIGMGKEYSGSHFVVGHASPDLDTSVASFWGFVDAFGAKVAKGLHIWNVPGGLPEAQVEVDILFFQPFGRDMFDAIGKTRSTLGVNALDLLTQEGMHKKTLEGQALDSDHDRTKSAVVLVDEYGHFLGDWRSIDIESVRQIIITFAAALRWIENRIQVNLIELFSQDQVTDEMVEQAVNELLQTTFAQADAVDEYTQKQTGYLDAFVKHVLHLPNGLESSFESFAKEMNSVASFEDALNKMRALKPGNGVFSQLKEIVVSLSKACKAVRKHMDSLHVALAVKRKVFSYDPHYLSHHTDVEEVRTAMSGYGHLTVNYTDTEGNLTPMGVVYADALQKKVLGTVSLRDFCNREEVQIPSYLEIISVIDHHKATIKTSSALTAHISDAQSSNAALAELAFLLNDTYGTGGMTLEQIESQLKGLETETAANLRVYLRLLKKKLAAKDALHHIDPRREYLEYLHFVYAILDDTDLLTKVSRRDIEIVASLLNRMKTIVEKKEQEVITFDDIITDPEFEQKASVRLLQNEDFYSLYSKVYASKETNVDENMEKAAKGDYAALFSDAKTLSGCNRVSQTKMYANNYPTFVKYKSQLLDVWKQKAANIADNSADVNLHMHMQSTVASADELRTGEKPSYTHNDELWFYIPDEDSAIEHMKMFLSNFKSVLDKDDVHLAVSGPKAKLYKQIFAESYYSIKAEAIDGYSGDIAILSFPAGKLNSRKAKIAPYLPSLGRVTS